MLNSVQMEMFALVTVDEYVCEVALRCVAVKQAWSPPRHLRTQ
jgi:hypothetical protein